MPVSMDRGFFVMVSKRERKSPRIALIFEEDVSCLDDRKLSIVEEEIKATYSAQSILVRLQDSLRP